MGARPSSFSRGGLFNNVDATIAGYTFQVGDTVKVKTGANKGNDFAPLTFVPEFLEDGKDENSDIRLLVGNALDFGEVSDDGRTLATDRSIPRNSEAGTFLYTLCNPTEGGEGFDENQLSEDPNSINYEPIIGTRVRLINPVDEEKTKRQGKQKNAKTGKEYDRRTLQVSRVYESVRPVAGKASGATKTTKPATTTTKSASRTNGSGKTAAVESPYYDYLNGVLGANDGVLPKAKLRMKLMSYLQGKVATSDRDAAIKFLFDDKNLAAAPGVTFDPTSDDKLIQLNG